MQTTIDVPQDVSDFAADIRSQGVTTVIRYYNRSNSSALPSKRIGPAEARALADAGLQLAVVFQQRGGANGNIQDLDRDNGRRDAARALELADELGQPEGSAVYFAVDHDYFRQSELDRIKPYFEEVRSAFGDRFRVGSYGSGAIGTTMRDAGFVDLIWLAGATGWSGTRQMLSTDRWALFQSELHKRFPVGGFGYDANVASPAFPDFGQFTPGAPGPGAEPAPFAAPRPAVPVLMEVIARSGLRVRSNPNDQSTILSSVPLGTIVHAIGQSGGWVQVDLEGDGRADGFMSGEFLRVASGGFPLAPVSIATATAIATSGRRPVDIGRAEQALDVREVPGPASNPRIVLYHGSTSTGAEPDEVPWCSSFMNYCVEQAGFRGTDSKWAMSWHDSDWATEVTGEPQDGDIAVFRRRAGSSRGAVRGGHVGFWTGDTSGHIRLLGGNQGNRIKLTNYPKNGMLGSFHYQLLSIRRP